MVLLAQNEQDMKLLLGVVDSWCQKWRVKISSDKTKVVHFRNSRRSCTKFKFYLSNFELEIVNKYKYLGVIFDEYLNFKLCEETLAESAGRALSGIISKSKQIKDLGFQTFSKLFESGVIPILDYGSEIWGFNKFKISNITQNKAIRYYMGVHRFEPTAIFQGDTGWLSCKSIRYLNMIRFWNRIQGMSNDRLTKQIFNTQKDPTYHINSWTNDIKSIFEQLNIINIFDNNLICNLQQIPELLRNLDNEEWLKVVDSKPKLRTYKLFKQEIYQENYLKYYIPKFERSLISQIRCGILPLKIETGRFLNFKDPQTGKIRKLKPEERICEICDTNLPEDEMHFMCICPAYNIERQTLFNQKCEQFSDFNELSIDEKFVRIMQNPDKKLGRFLKNAWEIRKNRLFI